MSSEVTIGAGGRSKQSSVTGCTPTNQPSNSKISGLTIVSGTVRSPAPLNADLSNEVAKS